MKIHKNYNMIHENGSAYLDAWHLVWRNLRQRLHSLLNHQTSDRVFGPLQIVTLIMAEGETDQKEEVARQKTGETR